jgi:hypothetical protein
VNLGTHRWSFKPEVGISKALGQWTLESQAAVTLYTDNTEFYGANTRAQDPLYQLQGHVIYRFPRGIWASLDVIYYAGARSTLNGRLNNDLQQNWRGGGTLAFGQSQKLRKLYASRGSRRGEQRQTGPGLPGRYRWDPASRPLQPPVSRAAAARVYPGMRADVRACDLSRRPRHREVSRCA